MICWPDDRPAHLAPICIALVLLVSATFCSSAAGQATEEEPAAPAAAETAAAEDFSKPMGPPDPLNRGTPRGSMYGYIVAARDGDYEKAAQFLDLRRLAPKDRERGAELARDFKTVLDQTLWVDFLTLSDSSEGHTDDGLPAWQDLLGEIETERGPVRLLLQRVPREGDGVRIWKVSAATVARIPALNREFSPLWLEEALPAFFFDMHLLDIALWQWLALILLACAAWLIALLLAGSAIRVLGAALARTAKTPDSRIVHVVRGPVRLIITVALFAFGSASLGLALDVQQWLRGLEHLVLAVAVTWLALRLIDLGALVLRQHMERRDQIGLLPALVPAKHATKGVAVLIALLSVLGTLGVNVTAAVAGLGVGGIAVALAAQKTIENLFGGITLFADQPVRVGDFFRFGDQVGTVEEIGLRSTRVRTLDRTVISVPNAEFSNLHLENFAKRDRMRLFAMIGVRYETTPEQLRYILVEVRKLLYAHERVTPDPARIRFVGFGAYSLDLEIFAYVDTSDWNDFLGVREDIYLRIMDIIEASGTGFAFPSQTLYLGRDESPSEERAREVAGEVRRWRERSEIFLPSFPPERIQALENTLAYPPEGSPERRAPDPPRRQGTD
jgi:MscS family membrane protein